MLYCPLLMKIEINVFKIDIIVIIYSIVYFNQLISHVYIFIYGSRWKVAIEKRTHLSKKQLQKK